MGELQRSALAPHARYRWDSLRRQHQLVFPEGLLVLNDTGAAIVQLCDGRPRAEMLAALRDRFPDTDLAADVTAFLDRLAQKGLLRDAADSATAGPGG